MKNYTAFIIALSFVCSGFAQITFQKTYSAGRGHAIKQTNDGGFIITGELYDSLSGAVDACLIKTNSNGDTLWTKLFGGSNTEAGWDVCQTSDGGFIMCGFTYSFGAGAQDIYIVKTDNNGNLQWSRTLGEIGYEFPGYSTSIVQGVNESYFICGTTNSFSSQDDIFVIKLDSSGISSWMKRYGGPGYENAYSIDLTSDGGIIVSGRTASFAGAGSFDAYLLKIDSNGNLQWSKMYGGSSYDYGTCVLQTLDGSYMLAGYYDQGGNGDIYFIKTNISGDTLWTKTYQLTSLVPGGCNVRSMQQTFDGGYMVAGLTSTITSVLSDPFLLKIDSVGNVSWMKTYGDTAFADDAFAVSQTGGVGFMFCGNTESAGSSVGQLYLVKTDINGGNGCNVRGVLVQATNSFTQVNSPNTVVATGGIIATPSTVVSSGCDMTTLCFNLTGTFENPAMREMISVSPNPVLSTALINCHLLKGQRVKINVYNLTGSIVATLEGGEMTSDVNKIVWNTSELNAGIYFLKMEADGFVQTKKVSVLR